MTPLDAAKVLADGRMAAFIDDHEDDAVRCTWCDGILNRDPDEETPAHYPGCPWLQLPAIVAVLEAAQAVVNRAFHPGGPEVSRVQVKRQPGYTAALKALARAMRSKA